MSTFSTIEKLKEELANFIPSSHIYTAEKSTYNHRLIFAAKHGILYPKEVNKYTEILKPRVQEFNPQGAPHSINVEDTLKLTYLHCTYKISEAIHFKMKSKQISKKSEIFDWVRKQEKVFSNGYYTSGSPWKETQMIDSLLKIGIWVQEQTPSITLREQVIEVIKLLMIKEKQGNGK
jgi:hypothetical protein